VSTAEGFEPTLEALHARLDAVRPAAYARTRNALDGAVSRLSPYLTHGFVDLPGVVARVGARQPLRLEDKFVFELGWRAYFRHVWQHRGDAIFTSLHQGPLPEAAYARALPEDVRRACTGVPAVDQAVRTLYATGYLHNHARMWLASYLVHLRKVHWRTGADWMVGHLLDGDLASNHLSWQWVAGTGSAKPYLFNAENVARFAPADWHSPGTEIDVSYELLQEIAAGRAATPRRGVTGDGRAGSETGAPGRHVQGIDEPARSVEPPDTAPPDPALVRGRDVSLVHPFALGEPPSDLPPQTLGIGWWPVGWHAAWPWSRRRWDFVGRRMAALTPHRWAADRAALGRALAHARSVQTLADPHLSDHLPDNVTVRTPRCLFAPVDRPCNSFSQWWSRVARQPETLAALPDATMPRPSR
jgi:deoxyribodipyrimidine photo-lyase